MKRPLRLEFPNALYHVTSRGDRRENIFEDDDGRLRFIEILGAVVADYNWLCHGYCLMDTQALNRRHGRRAAIFFKDVTKQFWLIKIAICLSFPAMLF